MMGLSIGDALKIGAGAVLGALLATGPVFLYARNFERATIAAKATKDALNRIEQREKNNAAFKDMPDIERCRAIMRDSGLPVSECD